MRALGDIHAETRVESGVSAGIRLDSWKAIADYLARDIRTVRRWEKDGGLPVHRVPGGRGVSVFAYTAEVDEWLVSSRAAASGASAAAGGAVEPRPRLPNVSAPIAAPFWDRFSVAARISILVLLLAGVVLAAWAGRTWTGSSPLKDLSVTVTPKGILANGPDGDLRWQYDFAASEQVGIGLERNAQPIAAATGTPMVVVGTTHRIAAVGSELKSGQILAFDPYGRRRWTFEFDDEWEFAEARYGSPWMITDFRVDEREAAPRIAVAAHHARWWPSLVTVLDERGRRQGTFVNSGWIESLRWLSRDRLLIAGFSNSRDAGIVGVLDVPRFNGHSPEMSGAFSCGGCGDQLPLRYIALPRSEINRVMAAPFNRTNLELTPDAIVARTIEVPASPGIRAADAVYEFSSALELRHAAYSDQYWDLHRALEAAGKLHHSRDTCPERDGPPAIQVWDGAAGWRVVKTR